MAMNDKPNSNWLVRHGAMRCYGDFNALLGVTYQRGARVIVRTDRGTETGEILCPATKEVMAAIPDPTRGTIVRAVTPDDERRIAEIKANRDSYYDRSAEMVIHHRLAMQIVDVEELFGRERLLFYFLANDRIDFRELVRTMAREFNARIELRQIGPRDETKLLADYGDCGKPVCCNTHLIVLPAVTMRMAKLQKSSLDPNKISGRCGRLKCCLRYEQDVYDDHQKLLPEIGSRVVTAEGPGKVLAQELLAKRILVEFEDGRRRPVPLADILTKV
ncbi:MAG: regulatory iron-sulfur-containing complex subunit RicT [Gemmataceae bacterium]